MNKRILVIALAAVLGAGAISANAIAQSATDSQSTSQSTTTSAQPAAKTKTARQRTVPPVDSRNCIRDTGSHIPPPKGQCLPVAGNSYSQQDIQRTGANNVGQALQMLDPSVTIRGH